MRTGAHDRSKAEKLRAAVMAARVHQFLALVDQRRPFHRGRNGSTPCTGVVDPGTHIMAKISSVSSKDCWRIVITCCSFANENNRRAATSAPATPRSFPRDIAEKSELLTVRSEHPLPPRMRRQELANFHPQIQPTLASSTRSAAVQTRPRDMPFAPIKALQVDACAPIHSACW